MKNINPTYKLLCIKKNIPVTIQECEECNENQLSGYSDHVICKDKNLTCYKY